jgi:cytidylate kinase
LKKINVAIDGPAGAGKSTIARLVAKELGYIYVDTGAMYRAITLNFIRRNVDITDSKEMVRVIRETDIKLIPTLNGQYVYLNDEDVTTEIRSMKVTELVARTSTISEIRKFLVHLQQKTAKLKGIVMDGRDIGTQVIPDAEVKIFLTASVRVRAQRRFLELKEMETSLTIEELMESIERRDRQDIDRSISPLTKADDALLIDSSDMTTEQVTQMIIRLCRAQLEE